MRFTLVLALLAIATLTAGANDVRYYPSYNKLHILVAAAPTSDSADVSIIDAHKKAIWKGVVPLNKGAADTILSIPDLATGEYTVTIAAKATPPYSWPIKRVHYAWEHNQLGITDKVYPPFTPMTVRGNNVGVVLRNYELDGLGLIHQITSESTELLASPTRLLVNGRPVEAATGGVVSAKEDAVVYEGVAKTPAVTISTHNTIEYDGCMKVEMTLTPGDGATKLESLRLEIPLKDSQSPLWHACLSSLRSNPAGYAPAGKGRVWDSTTFHDGQFAGNFLPYIWLGDERRGLCWFADNTRDWELDAKAPCLTIDRNGAELVLGINLIQAPITVDKPRTITFGLMASPAKPMPADWRNMMASRVRFGWIGSEYFGGESIFSAKYPRGYDYEFVDKARIARLTGGPDFDYIPNVWFPRHVTPAMSDQLRDYFQTTMHAMMQASTDRADYLTIYYEIHGLNITAKENQTFGWEWQDTPYPWWSDYLRKYAGGELTDFDQLQLGVGFGGSPSYTDFSCWYAAEFIKRGFGLYFDNTFPYASLNTMATDAYPLQGTPWGIEPSSLMWAQRDYYKRIWVLHQQLGPKDAKPLFMMHVTNTNLLPFLSFAMAKLDLEWRDETMPAQKKYSPELLRTESTGWHSGTYPLALGNIKTGASSARVAQAYRTRFGVFMVHEILHPEARDPLLTVMRDFGYGLDDCRVHDYWDKDYPVTVDDDRVKTLFLKRANKGMLLMCSWIPERYPEGVEMDPEMDKDDEHENAKLVTVPMSDQIGFQLDAKTIGTNFTQAVDAETGEKFAVDANGKMEVPLHGYGVRLLTLK